MYHQNWLEEMDQIGCCNGSKTSKSRSSNKNNSRIEKQSCSSSITTMNKGLRIRTKGGGSWRSYSSLVPVFWLILSVCSSMAVMAYQNDLSAISSSSSSISGKSISASGSTSRHGCVWSRTDGNSARPTASTTTTTSASYMSGMYSASGNNPFHHQQPQHTFPALSSSSSSSSSPYYSSSLLTSGFSGAAAGSSSSSGSGGVLTLDCNVRTMNIPDLHNYTASFTREQVEQARVVRLKCNDKLFFESVLTNNQSLFQLRNLQKVQIDQCKIRKLPKGLFSSWTQLRQLEIKTENVQWSPSIGLEIEAEAFEGLSNLVELDLSQSNIQEDKNIFCPLRSLLKVNMSMNRLTDLGEFGFGSGGSCVMKISNLDLSFNSLRSVTSNGFSRLTQLVQLRLNNNLLEILSDNSFSGLTQLKLIDLSSNRLVALPPRVFKENVALSEIYLSNNSISALAPEMFAGLHQLVVLNLSHNTITSQWAQKSIFSGLLRLIILNLSYNQLTSISDPAIFTDLVSLQVLNLQNNMIESIHPNAFQSLKNLHSLNLSRNRLTLIDSRLLSSLFVLRQLYLDHNQIRDIDDEALKNCTSIQDIGFSNNLLNAVPYSIRNLSQLATLDIGENRIEKISSESFSGLSQMYGLRMFGNRLTQLPASGLCDKMTQLRALNVANNQISKISSATFRSCLELRVLRLDANNLEELPVSLAGQMPSLLWLNVSSQNRLKWVDYKLLPPSVEWLDVSHNQLESLGGAANDGGKTTYHLRVLDASFNNLKSLNYTNIPLSLEILRLSNNKISTIAPDTFSRSSRLTRVELVGNMLENLPLSALRFPPVESGKPLPEFYIRKNPFVCDCGMEWLTRVSQLAVLRQHPRIVDLDAVVCRPTFPRSTSSSSSLSLSSLTSSSANQVIPIVEAQPKDFLCPYTSHCFALCQCCEFDACDCEMSCPSNCTCYHDTAWSSNIVDCSNLQYNEIPPKIPMDATELFMDGNNFQELSSHIFIGKKNLRVLHLNNSGIESIRNKTFNGLKSLELLMLNDNKLSAIHGFEFAELLHLRELYLQNNNLRFINHGAFNSLKFLSILRIDGNELTQVNLWELTKSNGYLNSIMLSGNPWTCDCEFLIPFKKWVAGLHNTIVLDFALAKCQEEQQYQQQDGNNNSSSAILNSGGSASTTTTSTIIATSSAATTITNPTISSMCSPLTQISFNYKQDNPALLPSAASSSSSNGGSNHVVVMNNHISSMGGAGRNNLGSLQLSGPYHHAHLENQAGNYHQGFPQNENIIATTAAAGGGGLRRSSKTGYGTGRGDGSNDDDDDSSTFFTLLLTFIAVILVASIAFLVGLVTFRKRGRLSQSSSSSAGWRWWCFSKCGINGASALPKCLAPNSSSANDGASTGTPGLGGNSTDMDYYYYSDQEKLFDAYFIYSQKDEEFVTEKLTCELERGGVGGGGAPIIIHPHQQHYYPAAVTAATLAGTKKLRLCLHYRDLCLAPDNPWSSEMILSACDASKRVVLVISNNFLNGEWTNNHFRTSVHAAIQQHCRKLIVIKFPPVSDQSVSSICNSIVAAAVEQHQKRLQPQHQQRNNNCGGSTTCIPGGAAGNKQSSFTPSPPKLEWGDKNFWPKFRLLLPTPQVPSSTGNNNRNETGSTSMPGNFHTMSSTNSQLPYTTNLNHNGMSIVNAANNGAIMPYQIPMIASPHHYHQPSDPVSALVSAQSHQQHQQQQQLITLMNWPGQQGIHGHSSSVHPVPSQVTPQHFGYSNIDGFHQNNMSSQQNMVFPSHQQQQQSLHFSSSNNRQSYRQQHHSNHLAHPLHQQHHHNHHHNSNHNNPTGHGQHIHSLSQLSNMSSSKSPMEVNYSSSAVSSGNEEFDHVYSTLDSPLESPCSDLGPGHVAGQFEGAMISGAQVNRHQIQHSTSSGISSGSDATSGTGGCHPGNGGGIGNGSSSGPPMYFV